MPPHPRTLARRRRVIVAIALLALVAGACTGSGGDATVATAAPATTAGAPSVTDATTTSAPPVDPASTTTLAPRPTQAPQLVVGEGIDPEVAESLELLVTDLVAETEAVRGLPFLAPPRLVIVTATELVARVRQDVREDLGDVAPDERLLRLLGILGPDQNLLTVLEELLAEQVLGFYDGDTGEMVVAGESADLSVLSRVTIVHELIHLLVDQHFSFHATFEQLVDEQRFDEAAALQALVEGDATYFQLVYIQESLNIADLLALQLEIDGQDFSVLEASPEFLQADLSFPYDDGFRFVTSLVTAGGIAAVDQAYVEPPTTTEQVLHPDRYEQGEIGQAVELIPVDLPGYELYEQSTHGEWGLALLLVDALDRGLVTQVVDGWGGDSYFILDNGESVVMAFSYLADREQDAIDLADAFAGLLDLRFGEEARLEDETAGVIWETDAAYGLVRRATDEVLFVVASDPIAGKETVRRLGG